MIAPVFFSLVGALAGFATAQAIEPADFNVAEALLDLGVNVTELPDLSQSAERSSDFACKAASQEAYDDFTGAYWSLNQAEVDPYCIFKPFTAKEMSVLVLLSRLTQCPFAVKSGGHAAFEAASNIEGGITVSLEKLNKVEVSRDRKTVTIQPGNVWSDVYGKLDAADLTVTGGRVSRVGTGGLTLGGGISFFANLYGWACDNVISYEVVTATGLIIQATPKMNPSLYWALRGGGNNFGIITEFIFEAIPLPGGKMWGGTRTYLESSFDAVSDAFAGVIANSPKDPNAGLWVAYLQNSGLKLAATELWYAKPGGSKASIFDGFNNITAIADTTQNRVLHEYAVELQSSNPYGLREVYYGLTVKATPAIAKIARDIFFAEYPAVAVVTGGNPVLIQQGITEGQIKNMQKNGGNPLGVSVADGPLYLIHVACWWQSKSDDKTVYSFISKVLTRIQAEGKKLGVENDYIYMNYASEFQDVIANYGPDNVAKLKKVAALYDPTNVFQDLQPGHFKLDRAPAPNSGLFSGLSNSILQLLRVISAPCKAVQCKETIHDNLEAFYSTSDQTAVSLHKRSPPNYHRASFSAFLRFAKSRVNTDWNVSISKLLTLIESGSGYAMSRNHLQELYLWLHILDVYTVGALVASPGQPVNSMTSRDSRSRDNIAPVICLTLKVPREQLAVLIDRDSTLGTPPLHCSVGSPPNHLTPYENHFAALQIGFGTVSTRSNRFSKSSKVEITEDGSA
ncbi:hypothetical protein DL765_003912 [Monosporascus sp. GIB2]|nr:hypothetical protein DL765_003912 [Monosporascus sp. GIB2]